MMSWMSFEGPTFTLESPSTWMVSATPQFQAVFLGPQTGEGTRPNLTISMRPVQADVTVSAVAQEARHAQEADYPQYQVLAEDDFTQRGGAAFFRRYQWVSNDLPVVQTQLFIVYEQILYTLTATITESVFEEVQPIFDHMLQTFRLLTPTPQDAS